MKKSTVAITIVLIVVIVGVVGVYAIMTGRAKTEAAKTVMTPVQEALSRDLEKDYPATVKEVVKYYTELEKCFYNEDCTEEEIEQLGMQARALFDEELLANNDVGTYLMRLKKDIQSFRDAKRRISTVAVASSTSVKFFEQDNYEFAKIYCGYAVRDNTGKSLIAGRVYLLRRNSDRQWKIYGWEDADAVDN